MSALRSSPVPKAPRTRAASRNRPVAVERTVPFGFVAGTIAVLWYVNAGHHPDDVQQVREGSPW